MRTSLFDLHAMLMRMYRDQPHLKPSAAMLLVQGYHVLDGDTVTCLPMLSDNISAMISLRIQGVDTPETHTKNKLEKQAGLAVKRVADKFLAGIPHDKMQVHLSDERGKYAGRKMGDIGWEDGMTLADTLLSNGLCMAYQGGTKAKWTTVALNQIISRCHQLLPELPPSVRDNSWAIDAFHEFMAEHR